MRLSNTLPNFIFMDSWNGLVQKKTSRLSGSSLCHGLGQLPLDQIAQPGHWTLPGMGLETLQDWGLHHIPGRVVPVFDVFHCKNK